MLFELSLKSVMMSKRNPLISGLCLLGLLLWETALAGEVSLERGLLFEVRSRDNVSSYLFGTIHSEDARVVELPSAVRSAFDGARVFVMEVVPDAEAILQSMVAMVYTDGRTLADVIGNELFQQVVAAVETRGMSEEAIKDFKPWAIVAILSVPSGKTGEFLDLFLYKTALADGKPVIGLETMEEQIAVLGGMSEGDQVALLEQTLKVCDELPDVYERLLDTYVRRDLGELLRLGDEYLRGGDSALGERFKAAALDVRNVRMTERMMPLLEQGGHFVAVGALHLPGSEGILARLRAAGLEVRPVY